jgi:ketosteroid isomerase-like protein
LAQPNADTVRALFESYRRQDRAAADRLIADGFVFTSPQDDHIDRTAFFERCFPTAARFTSHELLEVVPTDGDDVFVLYEYELEGGQRHRNAELITVRDGRITETQVFFGGRV